MILGLLIILQIPNVGVISSSGQLEDTKAGIEERADSVLSSDVGKNGWPWDSGPSEERTDFLALPTAPLMEARWWPAQSYSTLSFATQMIPPINGKLYIWAWILRDADPVGARWFTFWFDNNLIQMAYIVGEFKSCVEIPADKINWDNFLHKLEVSVDGCSTEKGWKLQYLWLGIGSSPTAHQTPPCDLLYNPYPLLEYTPQYTSTTVSMEYLVYAGTGTELQIQVQNVADTTTDTVEVHVYVGSWIIKGYYNTGGAKKTIALGNYADGSLLRVRLRFYGLTANQPYNKRVIFLGVTHIGNNIEIDYMDKDGQGNPEWTTSIISQKMNTMNEYYRKYAYHRVAYEFSDTLPFDAETSIWDHWWYHNPWWLGGGGYDDHYGLEWVYTIWVYHLAGGAAGWTAACGSAIEDPDLDFIIWHEYGHTIGIENNFPLPELYCQNPQCVMNGSSQLYMGTYCFQHWLERVEA